MYFFRRYAAFYLHMFNFFCTFASQKFDDGTLLANLGCGCNAIIRISPYETQYNNNQF